LKTSRGVKSAFRDWLAQGGPKPGRQSAVGLVKMNGIEIPQPHDGVLHLCASEIRAPKLRR